MLFPKFINLVYNKNSSLNIRYQGGDLCLFKQTQVKFKLNQLKP